MAGVIRKYPGLGLLAKAAMLAAFVGLGAGISSAQPLWRVPTSSNGTLSPVRR